MADYTYQYDGDPGAVTEPKPPKSSNGTARAAGKRNVVEFPLNQPVQMALKFAKPKLIDTPRGIRYMATTVHNTVAFFDADAALKMEHLQLKPGELFWVIRKDGELCGWDVYLDPSTEQAREPKVETTVKKTADAPVVTPAAPSEKTVNSGNDNNGHALKPTPGWSQHLVTVTNELVDVYATCLEHSRKHNGAVRNEDVRALLTTAFIQQCSKKGRRA